MHTWRVAVKAGVVLVALCLSTLPDSTAASVRRHDLVSSPPPAGGIVGGTVRNANNAPLPKSIVRLRNTATGRPSDPVRTDARGEFRFLQVSPAVYVAELVNDDGAVLAISHRFSAIDGQTVSTIVLRPGGPWSSGFFGNAAAAAISAASALGITAFGSNGRPASPQ